MGYFLPLTVTSLLLGMRLLTAWAKSDKVGKLSGSAAQV